MDPRVRSLLMAKLNQERFTARDFELDRLNNPDAVTDYQTSLSFEQPLFVPKDYIGFGLAKKEAVAKEGDLKRKREEIAFLVVRAYLDIQTAADFVRGFCWPHRSLSALGEYLAHPQN